MFYSVSKGKNKLKLLVVTEDTGLNKEDGINTFKWSLMVINGNKPKLS